MSSESLTRRRILQAAGVALASGIAGCNGADSSSTGTESTTTAGTSATQSEISASQYTQVYNETIDSVVLVRTDQGQGTGFMFDQSHVVTNAHVVGTSESPSIRFSEGEWSTGTVAGTDPHSDLAVITVDGAPSQATGLPFIQSETTIGQEVVAIGNPYSLDGSLTTGVVSGIDRTIEAPTGYQIPDAIQTDAAVNPGNSGGPLMSLGGRVIAVINSGGGDNIAFGISALLTQRVVPQLIETGDYEHSYMGVSFTNVTPTVSEANGLSESRGVLIVDVVDSGPAEEVLQPSTDIQFIDGQRVPTGGDVILTVNGVQLQTSEDLMSYLALQTRPEDTVELLILRNGSQQTIDLQLGSRPE